MSTRRRQAEAPPELPNVMPEGANAVTPVDISHNLLGQRLGRKGRDTRQRILKAAEALLSSPGRVPLSLSAVAREASLAMTTLYLYFGDLNELLLALLEPITATAEEGYIAQLRTRWSDEELMVRSVAFVAGFHAFWDRHARILHLRNTLADAHDERMIRQRLEASTPLIALLAQQMDQPHAEPASFHFGMSSALLTGIERLVTVATDVDLPSSKIGDIASSLPSLLRGQSKLLELGIREGRKTEATIVE